MRALNSIFQQWRISSSDSATSWNTSGEPCTGAAIDSTDIEGPNLNPGIKCDCSDANGTICHITNLCVVITNSCFFDIIVPVVISTLSIHVICYYCSQEWTRGFLSCLFIYVWLFLQESLCKGRRGCTSRWAMEFDFPYQSVWFLPSINCFTGLLHFL